MLDIALFAVFLICVAFVFNEGLWGTSVLFMNVLLAAVLATMLFEPLANWFDSMMSSYTYLWDFVAAWVAFAVCLLLLRLITNLLSRHKVRFKRPVDLGGGVFFAVCVGWLMVQFTLFTLHLSPLDRNFLGFQEKPETRMFLGLGPDRNWLAFMHGLSKDGSLARTPRPAIPTRACLIPRVISSSSTARDASSSRSSPACLSSRDGIGRPEVEQLPDRKIEGSMNQHSDSSSQVERDLAEYRQISGWAVAAAIFGVLSATALAGAVLWFIPVLGIVLALFAMRKITASEGELSGWNVALLGLLLSIFFGVAGPARTLTRRYWLETRAETFARQFIDLLQQDRTYAAHQLTVPPGVRKPLTDSLAADYAKDPESQKAYEEFRRKEPIKTLLEHRPQTAVDYRSSELRASDERGDVLGVYYRVTVPAEGTNKSSDVTLYVQRTLAYGSGTEQWQIVSFTAE